MILRTDLAIELQEMLQGKQYSGIETQEQSIDSAKITRTTITNEEGKRVLKKPKGRYVTVEVPPFSDDAELFDGRLTAISQELKLLLPSEGLILVAGLGNSTITPDALGPKAVSMILATRHIGGEFARSIGLEGLRPVATVIPGVLGQTGMETGEIISGVVKEIKPAAVIVIDALASRRLARLGCTVQMSDTGISPGSGVGNQRKEISLNTIGIPVISIGVPTVVDAVTLACDLVYSGEKNDDEENAKEEEVKKSVEPRGAKMIVTPREIDLLVERAARLIGMGINCALQTKIAPEDILALVS